MVASRTLKSWISRTHHAIQTFFSRGAGLVGRKDVRLHILAVLALIIVVSIAFWPTLSSGFVYLDDGQFFHGARLSTDILSERIIEIYCPLTIFTIALEKHFFGSNPFVFHLDNLILHIGTCITILFLARRMGLSVLAAFLSALLFGIHPMHVESVAWITERKDVLYSFFYVLALYHYWQHIKNPCFGRFVLTILFGGLSIYAKPMALSLPLILILMDWYAQRRWDWRVVFEKIAHIGYIVPVALCTYIAHARNPMSDPEIAEMLGLVIVVMVSTWIWSLTWYPAKFLFPSYLSPIYPEPGVADMLTGGLLFIVFISLVFFLRHNRLAVFAALYYFLSAFFLFRFDPHDFHMVADRFMYLPSLGLCLLIGTYAARSMSLRSGRVMVVSILITLGIITYRQCGVWKNPETHATMVLKDTNKNLVRMVMYGSRGAYRVERTTDIDGGISDLKEAAKYMTMAINSGMDEHYPRLKRIYYLIGRTYVEQKNWAQGLAYLREVEMMDGGYPNLYPYLGWAYYNQKRYWKAYTMYRFDILHNPSAPSYNNLAQIYRIYNRPNNAMKYVNMAIDMQPSADSYWLRSILYNNRGDYQKALVDARRALRMGYVLNQEDRNFLTRLEAYTSPLLKSVMAGISTDPAAIISQK